MVKLQAGDKAPDFTLLDHDGDSYTLSKSLKARKVRQVIYFYPKDDTPGCTKEACQFNDALAQFDGLGISVIGISADAAASHARFRDRYGLEFRLLSDSDHAVMKRYGAYGEKTMYGKKTLGVIRSTFLIDEGGKVVRAWYHVRADGHASKVLAEAFAAS